jgi:hypothetical protein
MNALAITTIEGNFVVPVTFEPRSSAQSKDVGRSSTNPDPDVLAQEITVPPNESAGMTSSVEVKAPFHAEGIHRWFRDWGLNE